MRKLVAMLVLLVLGMVVGAAGAMVIKTNINFVGPGTVSNKVTVDYGGKIFAEGTSVNSPYMTYAQSSTEKIHVVMDALSKNKLEVSSTKNINFNSWIYMSRFFTSEFTTKIVNGSISYETSSNHLSGNYTRNILVSAESMSFIRDFEDMLSIIGHDFTVKGTVHQAYFNSSSVVVSSNKKKTIIGSLEFNVPYYNISGSPSFNGYLTEETWSFMPITTDFNVSINVRSLNASNVVSKGTHIDPFSLIINRDVDISGVFNTLNNTTTFYSEYVKCIDNSPFFP